MLESVHLSGKHLLSNFDRHWRLNHVVSGHHILHTKRFEHGHDLVLGLGHQRKLFINLLLRKVLSIFRISWCGNSVEGFFELLHSLSIMFEHESWNDHLILGCTRPLCPARSGKHSHIGLQDLTLRALGGCNSNGGKDSNKLHLRSSETRKRQRWSRRHMNK